jgi:MFS family permease
MQAVGTPLSGERLTTAVAGGALVLSVALGVRQTFGLFLAPMSGAHVVSLSLLAFSLAIQNLIWGIVQPLAGSLSDRYGPTKVIAGGALLYGIGLGAVALHPGNLTVFFGLGVLVGVGLSGTTFAVVISAVSREASDKRRATATALAAAGGSLGQVALVPVAQIAISFSGYQRALIVLALLALIIVPAGVVLRSRSARTPETTTRAGSSWPAIWTALTDRNYLFLSAGFFACGFQLAFIAIHLPTYLSLCHVAPGVGAASLAAIGFFNVIGTYGFGKMMDRVPPHQLLTALYTLRSTAILAFVAVRPTAATTLAFAAVMGLAWLGTVPLTNGVISRLYGVSNLGALFGACFLSHQVGSFLGAWLGALALQQTGSYAIMWIAMIAVGYGSALVNLFIRMKAVAVVPA